MVFFAAWVLPRGRVGYHDALARLITTLTRSDLVHVAIGFGGTVLDPAFRGNRLWPAAAFFSRYPGLVSVLWVTLDRPLDFRGVPLARPKPAFPTFVRWCSGGRTPAPHDCVQTVARLLREAGVPVPPRITSPRRLREWLLPHAREALA